MAIIHIPISEKLARKLEEIAQQENRSPDELASEVLEQHFLPKSQEEQQESHADVNPLDAIMGLFDDDVTDMSSTVKETMREYHKNKKWKS
jgi:predicted transcriptional regulator